MSTTMSLLYLVNLGLSACGFAFIFLNRSRLQSVKGSAPRYRYASYCRVLQYPTLIWPLLSAYLNISMGLYGFLIIDALLFFVLFRSVKDFRDSDDEDFWSKLGKRLKRKLRSFARALGDAVTPQPALTPIPVKR